MATPFPGSLEAPKTIDALFNLHFQERPEARILEAGCGSLSHLKYPKGAFLVGIDISEDQLERNSLLNERILGDLQTHRFAPGSFDLIVCWDVLEHLPRPSEALMRMFESLREGGLVLLASPNVLTLRGILTKFAPHWLKVAYYRYVVGDKNAGKPGHYPFKSYHRWSIVPGAIIRLGKEHGMALEVLDYTSWHHPEYEYKVFRTIWDAANRVVSALTGGLVGTDEKQGFQLLLRKTHG